MSRLPLQSGLGYSAVCTSRGLIPIFAAMNAQLRAKENMHIVFWLIKDFAWISGYHVLGVTMAFPTVLLAFYLTWASRLDRADLFHNAAISCWILANALWMLGEFYFDDTKRHWAMPFFLLGLGILAWFYLARVFARLKS